jgi:hypothetical protein
MQLRKKFGCSKAKETRLRAGLSRVARKDCAGTPAAQATLGARARRLYRGPQAADYPAKAGYPAHFNERLLTNSALNPNLNRTIYRILDMDKHHEQRNT